MPIPGTIRKPNSTNPHTLEMRRKVDPITGLLSDAENAIPRSTFYGRIKKDPVTLERSNAPDARSASSLYAARHAQNPFKKKRIIKKSEDHFNSSITQENMSLIYNAAPTQPVNVIHNHFYSQNPFIFYAPLTSAASQSVNTPSNHFVSNNNNSTSPKSENKMSIEYLLN